MWGFTGAPLVVGNLLVLNVGEAGVAVDKADGKIAWQSAAKDAGYSTPLPVEIGGAKLVMFGNSDQLPRGRSADGKGGVALPLGDAIRRECRGPGGEWRTCMFISTGYSKGGTLLELTPTSRSSSGKRRRSARR